MTASCPDYQDLWEYVEKSQEVGTSPSPSLVIFFAKAEGSVRAEGRGQLAGLLGCYKSPSGCGEQQGWTQPSGVWEGLQLGW